MANVQTRRRFLGAVGASSGYSALGLLTTGIPGAAEEPSALARRLAADPDRPRFHFLPPANWMNDPNGPIWHGGRYHMYYQYNPKAAKWDTMHWGYAVSPDLVHWEHKPIALKPTPGGPDHEGCFTGCAVLDGQTPTLIYTGVNPEKQCLATSQDMQHWTKLPEPVIAKPPEGLDTPGFRDPQVWKEDGQWHLALGAGIKGKGGVVLHYVSGDLRKWEYQGFLHQGAKRSENKDAVASGEMWECPDFFPVGNRRLLYVSTEGTVRHWVGDWKGGKFTPLNEGILIHGSAYAPKSCRSADGQRQLIWSWLREQRSGAEQLAAGWSGVLSLAAVPSLDSAGTLQLSPAKEYERLRGRNHRIGELPEDGYELDLDVVAAKPFALRRGDTPLLEWNPGDGTLASGKTKTHVELKSKSLKMRVFVDGSVIEVFTQSGVTVTGRVYGAQGGSAAEGSFTRATAWSLSPISQNRLTT